ncbi:MAG: ketose-bisphosphate aldolase, partial [Balneolaceae bacterium]
MSLVSAKMMLEHARDNHYGVAAININNLEWTKLVLEVAQEKNSPMLLGVSEGAVKYMGGFNVVVQMVRGLVQDLNITVPVALHLDHGSFDGAKKAIAAGFTSVMYDGSHLPLEENLAKTREIVKLAHEKGVSVEAEVGSIGGEEDGVVGLGELADPVECQMLADTGIDFLAAGIGNIHGVYPDNWQGLDFELLAEVQKASNNLPLVLHGGTGIPEDQVLKAISLGVAKINVNTE